MSIVFQPEEEKRSLPSQILYEINIILDESKPLPLRAALLLKWWNFIKHYAGGETNINKFLREHELEEPMPEKLSPSTLRKYAEAIVERVAVLFYTPK